MSRREVTLLSSLVMVVAGGAFEQSLAGQAGVNQPRILVMPFENTTRDGATFWLSEASAVLLADNLKALGLSAITRAERQEAFERLQVPPAAVLTNATVIRIAQLVGADGVIIGSLQLEGGALAVRARSVALQTGRVEADITERGPVPDLFTIFDRITSRLAGAAAIPAAPAGQPVSEARPPVAAFENYIKGLLAETPATAIKYLSAALTAHPRYDRARLALWDVHTEQGDHANALAAVQPVPLASTWVRQARFLAGVSQISLERYDQAFATYKTLADQQPTATAWNNLGIVQMRRSGPAEGGLPTYYFDQAAKADPDDPDYHFNLGYAYLTARDYEAAMYWLREAVRRDPADGDAHFVLGAALAASGNAGEAARETDLARKLSSTYEEWLKRPAAEQVPKGLERIKNTEIELPHARQIEAKIMQTSQRDGQELAAFYLDRARRLFEQNGDREALGELDRALYLSPYLAEGHLLVGRIHLRNGRAREAIDALKISLWSAESADAHVALAEAYVETKDVEQARIEAGRALALDPRSEAARRLVDMLKSP